MSAPVQHVASAATYPRYSLHKILDESELGFEAEHYSLFKFGDERLARRFGEELAEGFAKSSMFQQIPAAGLALAVCYENVPTPAVYLRKHFIRRLNELLPSHIAPCEPTHVVRKTTFFRDFSNMTAEQRLASLNNDDFQILSMPDPNRVLVSLDDIRITGTHERKMLGTFSKQNIPNPIWVIYFAELMTTNIDPQIENRLNWAAFPSLDELAHVPRCGYFVMTSRLTKVLLQKDGETFQNFIREQSSSFRKQLYDSAMADRWNTVEKLAGNFGMLQRSIEVDQRMGELFQPLPTPAAVRVA